MSERQGPRGMNPWTGSDLASGTKPALRIVQNAAPPPRRWGSPDYTTPPSAIRETVAALVHVLGIPRERILLAPSGDIVEVSDEAGKPTLLIVALRGGR